MKTGAIAAALFVLGAGVNLYFGRRGFMPLDQSIVFDGGWRLLSGQVPFRDFTAPSGLVPSAMQVPFFAIAGVSWFALCLHASVVNGLFAVAVYALLRVCGGTSLEAAAFGALSAFFFYPPTGTPFMDQHSFFFMTLMFLAAAAGTAASGLTEFAAWAVVPVLFTLGYFSGQIPISFGAVCVAIWVLTHPKRAPKWIAAIAVGTLVAGVCLAAAMTWLRADWKSVARNTVTMPLQVGGERTVRAGIAGPARIVMATLFQLPAWLKLWSFDAALILAIPVLLFRRTRKQWPIQAFVLIGSIAASVGFLAYTRTLIQSGFALVMVIVAIVAIALRDMLPKPIGAIAVVLIAAAAVRDTALFVSTVDGPRLAHVRYDPAEATLAIGHLPAGLEFMRWSRGPSSYDPAQMTALVKYLREADGNFLLIGDSSVLYGLTRKPSVSSVLWFDPGLTIPALRTPDFARFEHDLVERARRQNVRRIVMERPLTWTHLTLDDFPELVQLTKSGACGEKSFGVARVLEMCPQS